MVITGMCVPAWDSGRDGAVRRRGVVRAVTGTDHP